MSQTSSVGGFSFSEITDGLSKERLDKVIEKMLTRESNEIKRTEEKQKNIQTKMDLYNQLNTQLTNYSTAAGALATPSTFSMVQSSSTNTLSATLTPSSNAIPGQYSLVLNQLAQAQKIASAAQQDPTTPLNLNGTLVINEQAIQINSSDNLTQIAFKINSTNNAGVTANVINGGSGQTYLTIGSSQTGLLPGPLNTSLTNVIQIVDLVGNVASSLNLVQGTPNARNVPSSATNSVLSSNFSTSTLPIGSLMGSTNLPSGNITINGVNVSVNMNANTLQDVVNSINSAGAGVTASIIQTITYPNGVVSPNNQVISYAIQIINGTSSAPTLADPNNILAGLGVLQANYGNQVVAAQNATYTLDGIALSSPTNTVENVIPGSTLNLLLPNAQTVPSSTNVVLTLSSNYNEIQQVIQNFQTSYNAVVDFIQKNSTYDNENYKAGALFHDFTATQIQSQMSTFIFNTPPNLTGVYQNLTQIGFSFGSNGQLNLNTSLLNQALTTDLESVAELFMATGRGSNDFLSYVSANQYTQSSGLSGYAVDISQPATEAVFIAGTAQTNANPSNETLSFSGNLFGSPGYSLVLNVNNTISQTITQINTDATLQGLVVAANNGGFLQIQSKFFGSAGNFTVVSDLTAANNNSGIGTGGSGTYTAGLDIAGTINGEPTTGYGQFLYGNSGNPNTTGLGVTYIGTATGIVGQIFFTNGVGAGMQNLLESFTDSFNGFLTTQENALQTDYTNLGAKISQLKKLMQTKEEDLRKRLAAMEQATALYHSQSHRVGQMLSTMGMSDRKSGK